MVFIIDCSIKLDLSSLSLVKHTLKLHAENGSGGKTDPTRTIYRYNYPPGEDTWYLAEGTTDWSFST